MSVSIEDLKPKSFPVKLKVPGQDESVELQCKPLRLSHTLMLAKIGKIFKDSDKSTREGIKQAEEDFDWVVAELLPELKDTQLDMATCLSLIEQMMETIEPSDNAELRAKGVKLNSKDPKAKVIG